jgi:CRP-like cAMP-binding protein
MAIPTRPQTNESAEGFDDQMTTETGLRSEAGFASPKLPSPAWATRLPPPQRYGPGTELIMQGAAPAEAYFIETGAVKLTVTSSTGEDTIAGLRPAGRTIALASVLLEIPQPISAMTLGRCEIRRIPSDLLRELLTADAAFAQYVQEELARGEHDQTAHVASLTTMSSSERLLRVLAQIAGTPEGEMAGREVRVPPLLKRSELAQLIGVTPQHLSGLLKAMESQGVISRHKGWLVLRWPCKETRGVGSNGGRGAR